MAIRKSAVLLPNVFQTNKNTKFLNATVDQLISEPNQLRVNGYIGRKSSPNYTNGDSYISEIDRDRQNYQLEPAVVYKNSNGSIESLTGYIDFINTLKYNGVNTRNHSDLFEQEYYNYSSFVEFDKLVNYGEYFWLPSGPDSVQVFNSIVDAERDYTVARAEGSYTFDNSSDINPTLILARGGSYTFNVNQLGTSFWIQTDTGLSGIDEANTNVSNREIYGVTNNGEDAGTITFNVPLSDAQDSLVQATVAATPDFATQLTYNQIHNRPYTQFVTDHGGIDGQTEIDGKLLVFVNTTNDETAWDQGSLYDAFPFDSATTTGGEGSFDTVSRIDISVRYDVYNIEIKTVGGQEIIVLSRVQDWANLTKVKIKQGVQYGNREFFKNASGYPELIAPFTANLDRLYYQDATNLNQFGIIEIVNEGIVPQINVTRDIIGKTNYTSTNSVVFTNGLKVQFNSDVTPSSYADKEFYIEGVGKPGGIVLVAVDDLITPETYAVTTSDGYDTIAYDVGGFDGTLNSPTQQDYIIINRGSPDLNSWTRNNRWFHISVIEETAKYNNYIPVIDQTARAKRPIIEFHSGLELFNMGTSSVSPVTVVDITQTDAFSNVNGTTGYFADGIDLQQGRTVIFSADIDASVRTKIYRVDLIDQDSDVNTDKIINLVEIGEVSDGNCVLSTLGSNNQGKQFWLSGSIWNAAQQKTAINQEPLFNVHDPDHVSFSDATKYPSSTFLGSKLFSYKRNPSASPDVILDFGLTYKNFNSIGDIVFENNFDRDTFIYTKSTGNTEVILRSGHAHTYDYAGNRSLENGWTRVVEQSVQHQITNHTVTSDELYSFEIGAPVDLTRTIQPLEVLVNGKSANKTSYTHLIQNDREYVVFNTQRTAGDIVSIKFFSKTPSAISFYEVPTNLENNSTNSVFETLTLGQMRNHTVTISDNIREFVGEAPGKGNIKDLNYKQYPGNILQHSAGAVLPMYLLEDKEHGLIDSIVYVKNEYSKFKGRLTDNINKMDLDLTDPKASLDKILIQMIGQKNSAFPFFYTDMLAWGNQKTTTVHTVDETDQTDFEFKTQFNLQTVSSRSVLVYHNDQLLVHGSEYTFDTNEPQIILTNNVSLAIDDTITIDEYELTDGSFVPPTPSSLGLWNKFTPRKYMDSTYTIAQTVIQGHDGSKWVGWGDIRDDILLEFEKRVYNNIKSSYETTLFDYADIIPGYFRDPLTKFNEFNNIVRTYFGEWSLRNKVRVAPNVGWDKDNSFTWNYKNSSNVLNGERVPGGWRGIYKWMFDTDTPHTTPWEMLGLGEKPVWWDQRYGIAPYTSGNTVLWEDLRDGKLYSDATGTTFTVLTNYKRVELMKIIPVNEQGALRSPNEFLVNDSYEFNTDEDWTFTDVSPVETAWRRSSEWPYVLQIAASVLKSAKYGTLFFDTNMMENNTAYNQILQTGKSYRPGITDFNVHGSTNGGTINRIEGYNQFISEYARYKGFSVDLLNIHIKNLQINLCYGVGGYTDKNFIKVIAESVSPSSASENIFIPDEDITIYTKKSAPLERVVYSGVQVIRRENGFEIQGYDVENPFFKIIPSSIGSETRQYTIGERTLTEYTDFESRIVNIAYGTIITKPQQVFDFLVSYQRYLVSRGFVFDNTTGEGERQDFITSGLEYAFWVDQNWATGSVVVLSPMYDTIKINRAYATADDIRFNGRIKDANGAVIDPKFYDVSRIDNLVTINVDIENTQVYSVQLDPIQYEHALVFNNTTIFNDIIFQPELGNRQNRLKLIGTKSGDWNGTLHAPGFFINSDQINIWTTYTDYKKGNFVSYQNKTYVAMKDHSATSTFDFNMWNIADNIQTGMIKNLANKASQYKTFFDMDELNLEDGVDKLGKGMIGFTNKAYLQGLGLDDVSQVKFYQGLIKNKGTSTAIDKLINADLTNLNQNIDYHEEWALRVGEFGSIDSNQVIEVVVPEQTSADNPTIVHFVGDGDADNTTNAYNVTVKDLYKTPNNYTGKVFTDRNSSAVTLGDLDTAGYVRLSDVDFTVTSDADLVNLNASELGRGKKIWVATSNNSWDVKRVDELTAIVTSVQTTANGFIIYTTDKNHGLTTSDYVVVNANNPVGAVAKVERVDSPSTFALRLSGIEVSLSDIRIPLNKLTSVRFTQPSDISTYSNVYGWQKNELAWVDTDVLGDWAVYRNIEPWSSTGTKSASGLNTNNSAFGTSTCLSSNGNFALTGAPTKGTGLVIPYVRAEDGALAEGNSISYSTLGDSIANFGHSVAAGISYCVIGAPATDGSKGSAHPFFLDSAGTFNKRPSLRPAGLSTNDEYGASIAMSGNGRHVFVGAPGDNKVYAYSLVEIPDGLVEVFTITGNGGTGYAMDFTPISAESIHVVDELGKIYLPTKDWTLSGKTITFTSTVAAGFQIVVRQLNYFTEIGNFTGSTSTTGDKFGFAIDVDHDGRYIAVGAPSAEVSSKTTAGEAFVFAQTVQAFAADGSTKAYTTQDTLQSKIYVEVNGVLQEETTNTETGDGSSINYYTRSSNTITFKYTPDAGDVIRVYTGTFREKQRIDQNLTGQTVNSGEEFGASVAIDSKGTMLAIGSPGEDETTIDTGSVFVFSDSGKNYGKVTSDGTSHLATSGHQIYINDYLVSVSSTSSNPNGLSEDINTANIGNVTSTVNGNSVVISSTSTEDLNKLTLNPGNGATFTTGAGFEPYTFIQKINHPFSAQNENFGRSIAFDKYVDVQGAIQRNIIISSDKASSFLEVGFDIETDTNSPNFNFATTTYDVNNTQFSDRKTQSGAAYIYELLDSYLEDANNPRQYVISQQLSSTNILEGDKFGASVAYNNGRIFVGAPGDDIVSGSTTYTNNGSVYEFNNTNSQTGWQLFREGSDRVDQELINRVALYNKRTGQIVRYLDYIDSAKGKVSGFALGELDFITGLDPALYTGSAWVYNYQYRLWWDTSTSQFLNAEQGNLDFRSTYWNTLFPGSSVDVYEWIESRELPSDYTGPGTVKYTDNSRFTQAEVYDSVSNSTVTMYYYWVKGITTVPTEAEFRNLSASRVEDLIADPKAQGLKYASFLRNDSIALYNCNELLSDKDVVLSVNYDVVKNEGLLHSEFELYGKGNVNQEIPTKIYNKMIDSLSGTNSIGNPVPDPLLSVVEKYGVLNKPRQSMFVNRSKALQVLVQYCNSIFKTTPVIRNITGTTNLNKAETLPTVNSGEYDKSVDNISERDFLNTAILSSGYRVLVLEDETKNNYWTVYSLNADKTWSLYRIQSYNTSDYWTYETYYSTGYDATTVPTYQVALESDLLTLTDSVTGDIAKVTNNDEGNFSMFRKNDTGWEEIIIERGTVRLSDSLYDYSQSNSNFEVVGFDSGGFDFAVFDKFPTTEVRNIITALNQDIFVGSFKKNMNELFFRLIEYAMTETEYVQDWVFKTSFITVAHKLRDLEQYSTYKFDNTTFIEEFINEVKPYKTKIREYINQYNKLDTYQGDTTDFDLHTFYDEELRFFRKPSGDYAGDEIRQTQGLNAPWSNNYGYSLDSIVLSTAGTGYITDPTITISAPDITTGVQATATAKTNGDAIVSITVTNKGSGYTSDPVVTVTGSGTGIRVSPRLTNTVVRSFDTTIKFDRITYSSTIKDWTASTAYTAGDVVAYYNTSNKIQEVYDVVVSFTSGTTFGVENTSGVTVMTVKTDESFANTADRISAYYSPLDGMIGDDLELLQKGTGYYHNKVTGPGFDQNPGFDQANFDVGGFDNFQIDSDGISVIPSIDTILKGGEFGEPGFAGSEYLVEGYTLPGYVAASELGLDPESIYVDGGKFVDVYNSHAPEELIPGRVYDTLDMEVYTHASNDYEADGNSSISFYRNYTTVGAVDFLYGNPGLSSTDAEYIVLYVNSTRLYNFTKNYTAKTVTIPTPLAAGQTLHIYSYSLTGEKIAGEYTYTGDGSTSVFMLSNIPDLTKQVVVLVDGVETTVTVGQQDERSNIQFSTPPVNGANIHVAVFNQATTRTAPSRFKVQTTTMTAGTYTYALDNTIEYAQPFSANTIVDVDGVRLRPANSVYHIANGTNTVFSMPSTAQESGIINVSDIGVAVIGVDGITTNMTRNVDYTAVVGQTTVTLNTAPAANSTVIVYTDQASEYRISGDGKEIMIDGSVSFTSSSVMTVSSFANHDPQRIQTKIHKGQGFPIGSYTLDRTASTTANMWVTLDGVPLASR